MADSNIIIRQCTEEDIPILVALGSKTFKDTFGADNTPEDMEQYISKTFTNNKIKLELNERGVVFFLAEQDGRALGYAKVNTLRPLKGLKEVSAMEIERLYSIQEMIGKGIGRMLMQHCLGHAVKNHCEVVWLGVWERNSRAIDFYKRWGFEKFDEHVFMLGRDAQTDHLMKREIKKLNHYASLQNKNNVDR
ncbi:GNAT family N-acetyltransferase [Chryseosolibacter indicus]|uniref:GNAT family N-acetyltransferase n=1 Tax=Chryseosolibacter indicus TaxID=2782351 RepID=A0ABS5VXE1_9BACT|nr:GNAT family N-acetyltransferase [Chryseosolibacter indicus]MBT1705517.1 GNAT family N-acetyltransferase [Chryseosolibacter indicus]